MQMTDRPRLTVALLEDIHTDLLTNGGTVRAVADLPVPVDLWLVGAHVVADNLGQTLVAGHAAGLVWAVIDKRGPVELPRFTGCTPARRAAQPAVGIGPRQRSTTGRPSTRRPSRAHR